MLCTQNIDSFRKRQLVSHYSKHIYYVEEDYWSREMELVYWAFNLQIISLTISVFTMESLIFASYLLNRPVNSSHHSLRPFSTYKAFIGYKLYQLTLGALQILEVIVKR